MKPYGVKRCESPACRYGCCCMAGNYSKKAGYRVKDYVLQTQRKRARQQGKRDIEEFVGSIANFGV